MASLWRNSWAVNAAWGALALTAFTVGPLACPHRVTETRVVEDTETKQRLIESQRTEEKLRLQLSSAEKTISELRVSSTERVSIVYKRDGTKTVERVTTHDISNDVHNVRTSSEVREEQRSAAVDKSSTVSTETHRETATTTMPQDKFYLGISSGVGITGLHEPGAEFKYRLLDLGKASIWAGAEVVRPSNPQFRLSVGISF